MSCLKKRINLLGLFILLIASYITISYIVSYSVLEDLDSISEDVKTRYNIENRSDVAVDKGNVEVKISSKPVYPVVTNVSFASKFIFPMKHVVDIWGKAAIGLYLWEHVFEGRYEEHSTMYSFGEHDSSDILFRFHTGPALTTSFASLEDVADVVLVLNGRESSKVVVSEEWLKLVLSMATVRNVGLVVLGNEQCNNTWLMSHIREHGKLIKFVFLVYDSPEVDNQLVYQWPLGVATYRSFPAASHVDSESARLYRCSFVGTIYSNSSRELLLQVLENLEDKSACLVKPRKEWIPRESDQSMKEYVDSLRQSDLTLNPVGMNPECYRIYEAMSYGSVPVIEDRVVSNSCVSQSGGHDAMQQRQMNASLSDVTFRLLKRYKAPVIYVSSWHELPALLEQEKSMTLSDIVRRRKSVIEWYLRFKRKMKHLFVSVVQKEFFK